MTPTEVRTMAESYTEAWCSHSPQAVASFHADSSSLTINNGEPATGRQAIAEAAASFMNDFSDLDLLMNEVRVAGDHAVYLWTLEGTNDGPGGSGHRVKISGWESWRLSSDGMIVQALGYFDAQEYARQIANGA